MAGLRAGGLGGRGQTGGVQGALLERLADGLLAEGTDHALRVELEREQRVDLTAVGRPLAELPALAGGIDLGALYDLADLLVEQGRHDAASAGRADRPAGRQSPPLDVDGLLDDPGTRMIVCCGAGGVGKTTTAAALALRAAERGRRVVVLTIDPARRLAQSMGLVELDNTPRPVTGVDVVAGGGLDAMMLDMKRTFDEVIEQHATPEKAAQIFANPFYQAMSSSFAGTQEYMAMEKLGQLRPPPPARRQRHGAGWDLIVVDTPPSRSALDFLDAPPRLGSFLDGRLIRILSAPAKAGGKAYLRVVSAAVGSAPGS